MQPQMETKLEHLCQASFLAISQSKTADPSLILLKQGLTSSRRLGTSVNPLLGTQPKTEKLHLVAKVELSKN